ncbi:MAG: serine/threonine protein kinase [Candidatus Schekmanbacteria bacterium]|nr:serine/threonine protein kinase [Candidatus Schekmanbacteria bacterium]
MVESGDRLADGRFEVRRRIGQGGMGEVFLCFDGLLQGEVALKVLFAHLRRDPAITERFRREAVAARMLVHPNIVRVFDLYDTPEAMFLAMEHVAGGSVRQLLRQRGVVPPLEVARIGLDACRGLCAAHEAGIIHRDIKPHNLLVGTDGGIRIADFGLAQIQSLVSLTSHSTFLGTPEYAPPELFLDLPFDPRSDVYSLGVVLYELLTGRLPFAGRAPYELIRLHAEEAPRDPRELVQDVPAGLCEIVLTALEKRPEYRFSTAERMATELSRFAEDAPTGSFSRAELPDPGGARGDSEPPPLPRQPATRAKPAAASRHTWACPSCSETSSTHLPICLSCGRERFELISSAAPGDAREASATSLPERALVLAGQRPPAWMRRRLVVIPSRSRHGRKRRNRHRRSRDYLTYDEKARLVSILEQLQQAPIDPDVADARLKEPPTVLLSGVDREQAAGLMRYLHEQGLPAAAVAPWNLGFLLKVTFTGRRAARVFTRVLVMVGVLVSLAHPATSITLPLVLLAAVALLSRSVEPLAHLSAPWAMLPSSNRLAKQARDALRKVSSPYLRGLLKGILERSLDLEVAMGAALGRDDAMPVQSSPGELGEDVHALRDQVVRLAAAAQDLEDAIAAVDERAIMGELEDLQLRVDQAALSDDAQALMDRHRYLLDTLERVEQARRGRDRAVTRLLAIDAGLANARQRLTLANVENGKSRFDAPATSLLLKNLSADVSAVVEILAIERGDLSSELAS